MTAKPQDKPEDGRLTRRRFIVGAAGAVAATGLHATPGWATSRPGGPLSPFAVVADSHLDPFSPQHAANMRAVFDHVLARGERPAFVEHVGDVVEAGFPAEYEEWRQLRPAELADRIHAVPGNHEVRWDERAKELYFSDFEPTPYSFDAAGVHVVALDPTQLLQEPGYFSRAQLEWLENDLRKAGKETPTIVFAHYPMAGDYFYVGNQDAFLGAVEGFNVRAVIAGHIHREEVQRVNQLTAITLPGVLNVAAYHWVAPAVDVTGAPALSVVRWQLAGAAWQATPVTQIALASGPRKRSRPPKLRVDVASDRSSADVVVDLHPAQAATSARARFWPESVFGGRSSSGWVELSPEHGGRRWRGALPAFTLAAGTHPLQVRAAGQDGAGWETTTRVELPATATDRLRRAWEKDLGAAIQAGILALPSGGLVAATVGGAVVCFDASGPKPRERWRVQAGGPVYGAPATDPQGQRVFVSTATRPVHALDAHDGRVAWTFRAPRPALGSPQWTDAIPSAPGGALIVPAGRALHALDASSGAQLWTANAAGFVGGRPVADESAVYAGAGDGKAHAFSLATGEQLWEQVLAVRLESPYRTLIYSPWAAQPGLLPADRVLVATVTHASALNRQTGTVAWRIGGGFMYNAPLLLSDRLILVDEFGGAQAVDPLTGTSLWGPVKLPQRVLGGSPTLWRGAVAIGCVNGLVALLDPATGADAGRLRAGVDYVHSGPAATGEVLAVGSQSGMLRSIAVV